MMTLFISLLLLAAILFFGFHKNRQTIRCLLLSFIFYIMVGCGLFSTLLLDKLQSSSFYTHSIMWKNANVIILLGAGTTRWPAAATIEPTLYSYSRILKAATLYNDCKKTHTICNILVSGGDALKTGKSEAEVYQEALTKLNINPADILIENKSMNTFQNAEFTQAILAKHPFDNVILVTSAIHLRRSMLYFSHFNIHALPVAADYMSPVVSYIPNGNNFAVTDFALHEYTGIWRYHIYNLFGLNARANQQGA